MKIRSIIFLLILSVSAFSAPTKGKTNCNKQLEKGVAAYEAKRYSYAVSLLATVRLNCIGGFSEPDSVYYLLGKSYMALRKFEEARLEFNTIVSEYPHSQFREEALYYRGYNSFRAAPILERENKSLRRALRELSQFTSEYPSSQLADSARIYNDSIFDLLVQKEIMSAKHYMIVEKYESAAIYYRSILDEFPSSPRLPEIKIQLATALMNAHRFTEAERILDELTILEELPDEVEKAQVDMEKIKRRQEQEAKKKR